MPKFIEELIDVLNLKSFKTGGFKRNFIFTVGAKAFVVSMSFVFTPILSRLFLPVDYGLFSLYSTIIANYLIFSTFGFSDALNVAREDRDFYGLLTLCSMLYAFFAVLLLVFGLNIYKLFFVMDSVSISGRVNVVIFVGALTSGLSILIQKLNIHYNDFEYPSKVSVFAQSTNRLTALGGGFLPNVIPLGLLVSDIASKLVLLASNLYRYWFKVIEGFREFRMGYIAILVHKFAHYPKFFFPSRYLGVLIAQLPIWFIARYFSLENLGHFAMASSLVLIPVNLLGYSLGAVYMGRFRSSTDADIRFQTRKLIIYVVLALLIPVGILVLGGATLLTWFLGDEWVTSGTLSQVMGVYIIHEIIVSIINGLFQIRNLEKQSFMIQIVNISLLASFLLVSRQLDFTLIQVIKGISIFSLLKHSITIHYLLRSVKGNSYLITWALGLIMALVALSI